MIRFGTLVCDGCDREIPASARYSTAAVDPHKLADLVAKLGLVTLPHWTQAPGGKVALLDLCPSCDEVMASESIGLSPRKVLGVS